MKRILLLSFMSLVVAFGAMAQRTVSGKITSAEDGSGVPGVNVVLKGTTTGTTSDLDGNYRLSVPEDGGTLVFSFVGLASQEMEIGARSIIDVAMSSDVQQLTEVVVTAYGIERASKEVTYQTEKIDSETLMQGQQQQAAQGLVGKIAGAQINVQDNGVNPNTQFLLRGLTSISKSNEALIVIDGSIASSRAFSALNTNDIESIDILKGPNAAALYGADAGSGAVIVTTKKGSKDGFVVGYNTAITWEEVSFMPDFQSEHGTGWDGAYDRIENTNWGPRFDGVERAIGPHFPEDWPVEDQVVPYAPIKNNLRDFYETGTTVQHTAYISGGGDKSTFYFSYGNQDVHGIVPKDTYSKNMFRANASKDMGKLKLSMTSSYVSDEMSVVGDDVGDQDRAFYWFILNTPANIPLKTYKDWKNPESYGHADNYYNAYYQNPYWAVGTNRDTQVSDQLIGNVTATYSILDNIKATGVIGVNTRKRTGKEWRDEQTYNEETQPYHSTVSSFLVDDESQDTRINGQFILSGRFNLGSDFTLKPIVGAAFSTREYRFSSITVNNLSIPGFYDISNGTGNPVTWVDESVKRTAGVFGDLTLGFREFVFVNVTGRQDITSTLQKGDNSYFYPSASVSFILTEAVPALQDNRILSYAKITASNSTVYNDLLPYEVSETYNQGSWPSARNTAGNEFPFPYGSVNGFRTSTTAIDAGIEKEKLNTTELGVNLGFLADRFSLDAAVYRTITTNLITATTPSYASGARSFRTNIGELENLGAELTLGGTVVNVGGFKWDLSVNYTTYKTVVNEIKEGLDEIALDSYGTYGTYAIKDKVFPQLKAQAYTRDPQGRIVVDGTSGNPVVGEVESMGKVTPSYILGGTTAFGFKGLTLSGTFDYRTGHVYFSQGNNAMEFTGRSIESVSSDRKDFVWPNSVIQQADGSYIENTSVPTTGAIMGFWQNTYNEIKENYVKDASALKIREVSLRYTLPQSLLSSTGFVSKVTVGFVARNLWVSLPQDQSNFSDPEFRNVRSNRTTGLSTDDQNGIGIGGYLQGPPTRSFGFNLNVEF